VALQNINEVWLSRSNYFSKHMTIVDFVVFLYDHFGIFKILTTLIIYLLKYIQKKNLTEKISKLFYLLCSKH